MAERVRQSELVEEAPLRAPRRSAAGSAAARPTPPPATVLRPPCPRAAPAGGRADPGAA